MDQPKKDNLKEKLQPGELVILNPDFRATWRSGEAMVHLQDRNHKTVIYKHNDKPLMFLCEKETPGRFNWLEFLLTDEIVVARLRKTVSIRKIFIPAK